MKFIKNLFSWEDPDAVFGRIEKEHRKSIWKLVLKRGLPKEAAEDVCQETWLAFHQSLQKKNCDKPEPLLYKIACNKIIDYYRRHYKAKDRDKPFEEESHPVPLQLNVDAQISFFQLMERAQIQENTRTYMKMRFICGMTYPEIADVFQVPTSTVRDQVNRAIGSMNGLYLKGRKQ